MDPNDNEEPRVRFYGPHDLAAGWYAPRAVELASTFDPQHPPTSAADAIELHNVLQYLEHGVFPATCSDELRVELMGRVPLIRAAIARFFAQIDDSNFAAHASSVGFEAHDDLIELLGRSKAFARCSPDIVIPALRSARVHLRSMLANTSLTRAYDADLRIEILAEPRNAELLVRKYLEKDTRAHMHLPASLTPQDVKGLFEQYIDSPDANLNYVRLISTAKEQTSAGIDAKLKLRAKRRADELNAELFKDNPGFKSGCEVSLSDTQAEPVKLEVDHTDGTIWRYTYGTQWLKESIDNASILNNFQHLFEFVDAQSMLIFPSYPTQFGVIERLMGLTGHGDYKISAAFRMLDYRSLAQTHLYLMFLDSQGARVEEVLSWFFRDYLAEEFGMQNFSFIPSDPGAPFLHRVRHLFAEMESVVTQFGLYVENGEIDRELLAMGADPVRYKTVPSLLPGKYLYPTQVGEITSVLNLLFSDQSPLTYINEDLKSDTGIGLILQGVSYGDFHHYQKSSIDFLISAEILELDGDHVRAASVPKLNVLRMIFATEGTNYYHLSRDESDAADQMVERGWLTRKAFLLSDAESDYFNYYLNRASFNNGPNLRNRYAHGTQPHDEGENAHYNTYLVAIRLLVALVIKINDDACLAASAQLINGSQSTADAPPSP